MPGRDLQDVHKPTVIVGGVGGGLTVLGSFLPWATVGPFSIAGTSGDGAFTILLGAAAIGLFTLWWSSGADAHLLPALALLASIASLAIIGNAFSNVEAIPDEDLGLFAVDAGSGLLIGGLGAGVSAVAALRALFTAPDVAPDPRQPSRSMPSDPKDVAAQIKRSRERRAREWRSPPKD